VILLEAIIAVTAVGPGGALKAHSGIAGIADVEIPVGRGINDDFKRAIGQCPLVDLEIAAHLLPALRTEISH